MELGITTFAETYPDPVTGQVTSPGQRLRDVVEEIELADRVGLDVYGVGEHHRADFAASAPAIVLAAAVGRTSRIRLTSAVTVLSSTDPVRVFQDFATLDLLSEGRAEIMAGRGSFIESFPLFGYSLDDYDDLYAEKLDLLLQIRADERVTWQGRHRAALTDQGVFPRPEPGSLPIWVAVGGNPPSVVRAAERGLPMALAIIGGSPDQFAPLADLHRRVAVEHGYDPASTPIAVHAHGYVGEVSAQAADEYYPSYAQAMTVLGRERGWGPMTRGAFDAARSPAGSLVLGDPAEVAAKILRMHARLGIERFMLHISVGTLPHAQVLRSIELLGTQVAPLVRAGLVAGAAARA
ncbi:LLM class flavin-dependent oxidoreductase [Pengzhenrongella frigida]|uniref:LLM class flavin-dependent oxidoreductase n=1 Tax=Pengzhenrongella frigida TaxID=1259133 RepID=A0A4Q5MVU5_9MICO|nr:LLM class flavin-dependent oxidoreductase [Cellulomonas sp. HLT2-17]RYV49660.1 LLM class flavin-dependent oxidoreductase [Cellulomonas sp. HLT2-17]